MKEEFYRVNHQFIHLHKSFIKVLALGDVIY